MTGLRLLADENVDHQVVHRLERYGHDIEHVSEVPELGKGTDDGAIAAYSLEHDRPLLTNDDDFLTDFAPADYRGLLFVEDETLADGTVADIVHAIAEATEGTRIETTLYVSRNWL